MLLTLLRNTGAPVDVEVSGASDVGASPSAVGLVSPVIIVVGASDVGTSPSATGLVSPVVTIAGASDVGASPSSTGTVEADASSGVDVSGASDVGLSPSSVGLISTETRRRLGGRRVREIWDGKRLDDVRASVVVERTLSVEPSASAEAATTTATETQAQVEAISTGSVQTGDLIAASIATMPAIGTTLTLNGALVSRCTVDPSTRYQSSLGGPCPSWRHGGLLLVGATQATAHCSPLAIAAEVVAIGSALATPSLQASQRVEARYPWQWVAQPERNVACLEGAAANVAGLAGPSACLVAFSLPAQRVARIQVPTTLEPRGLKKTGS